MAVKRRGKGDGSISLRKDGRYEGRYYVGEKRRTVYGKTRKEVAEKLRKAIAESGKPLAFVPVDITFSEFMAQYDDAVRGSMKRRSLETYRDIARLHLLPTFGTTKLKNLTRNQVQKLYSQKRDAGLSPARVRRIHGVLSAALNTAVTWKMVEGNVCKQVSAPKVPPPEIRAFNSEEAKRFLAAATEDRYFALYVLGISTGARFGELGGLYWSDVDLDRRKIHIQRGLITGYGGQTFDTPKTANSRRNIGLTTRAIEALVKHRKRQKEAGFPVEGDALVFTNTLGNPINLSHLYRLSFKPLLKRAGLPDTTFHAATRHTFCCLALEEGVNIRTISLAMGHASVAFTLQRYASYIPSYGDTADGLDSALS